MVGGNNLNEHSCDKANELLRGELSALETYNQVLEKFSDQPDSVKLRQIKSDHFQAVNLLKSYVETHGGVSSNDSGAWGAWAKTVTGAAKIFGNSSALKALREGEEHGIKEYQDVLKDPDVETDFKEVIRTQLLPNQREHIKIIETLM